MGCYAVPEEIRAMKPAGTTVKIVGGHYYVYECRCLKGEDGKWHTKMGRVIGSIKEGIGFIPNGSNMMDDEIITLEYGQYAVVIENSRKTLELLEKHFNAEDAATIYACSVIHFINGFTYMKDLRTIFSMSWMSHKWPGLKLGYTHVGRLYEALGNRQARVLAFEQDLIDNGSGKLAIDGHVIGSGSWRNDLAEKGYKFGELKEMQVNMLMAYDVIHDIPVAVKAYQGGENDKTSVEDILNDVALRDKLLIVDRGFYNHHNLSLFSRDGNSYIIPVPKSTAECKDSVKDLSYTGLFSYDEVGKIAAIEYKECEQEDGSVIYVFRDTCEAVKMEANYVHQIEMGKKGYTDEGLGKAKPFFGVYVLRTNASAMSAKEVFSWYKKRWHIETFYNYFSNEEHCKAFCQQDYYKIQGLSFILLVSSIIHREFANAVGQKLKSRKLSVQDVILAARMVKITKRGSKWICTNTKGSTKDLFKALETSLTPDFIT